MKEGERELEGEKNKEKNIVRRIRRNDDNRRG